MSDLETSVLIQLKDQVSAPIQEMGKTMKSVFQVNAAAAMEWGERLHDIADEAIALSNKIHSIVEKPKELAMVVESSFSSLRYASNLTGAAFDDLQEKTEALAKGTTFDFASMADGMGTLVKRGTDVNAALVEMGPIADLAEGGQMALAQAVDMTSKTLKLYQLDVGQASHYTDLVVASAKKGSVEVAQMGGALERTAESAHLFKVPIDTTATLLGDFTNVLVSSDKAASALSSTFSYMGRGQSQKKIAEGIQEIFGAGADVQAHLKDLPKLMGDVYDWTVKMGATPTQTTTAFSTMFGRQAGKDIATVMAALKGHLSVMGDVTGAAEKLKTAHENDAKVVHEKLLKDYERLQETLGTALLPGMIVFEKLLIRLIDWTTGLAKAHPELIKVLAVTATGVGVVAGAVGSLLTVITVISGARGLMLMGSTLKAAGTAAKSTALIMDSEFIPSLVAGEVAGAPLIVTLGVAAIAIAAIGAAAYEAYIHWHELTEAFTTWEGLKGVGKWIASAGTPDEILDEEENQREDAKVGMSRAGQGSAPAMRGMAGTNKPDWMGGKGKVDVTIKVDQEGRVKSTSVKKEGGFVTAPTWIGNEG